MPILKYKGRDDSVIALSFSKHARGYDRYARLQKMMADRLASFLPNNMPEKVLEIGCGSGLLSSFLRHQGYKITGLEPYSRGFEKLESGDCSLDEMLNLYEQGVNSLKICSKFCTV